MNSICILGGDLRLLYAFRAFRDKGFDVSYIGGAKCDRFFPEEMEQEIKKSDIILLGIPASGNGITLNAPFCDSEILLSDIARFAGDKVIFGGKIPSGVFKGKVYDIAQRDDFAMLNAVPTAEGALEIAMHETESTIFGSKCLVVGFGKIGKMLCKVFSGVGASVTATARKPFDLSLIEAFGYESRKTSQIADYISDYDIIINTVPGWVIGDDALEGIKEGALLIDTASKPGGFDMDKAKELKINAISALSLPGKVAPRTSGEIICNTVCSILDEPGV